jgi:hypothetical protein
MTLKQVSEASGIPLRTIHGIEVGDIERPRPQILRALAPVLLTSYESLALKVYASAESPNVEANV